MDDKQLGNVVDESELKLDVHATTPGGNQIVMVNNTLGVGSYWDYVTGRSAADRDTVSLPFLGEQSITFTGLCDGGTVTTTRKVTLRLLTILWPVSGNCLEEAVSKARSGRGTARWLPFMERADTLQNLYPTGRRLLLPTLMRKTVIWCSTLTEDLILRAMLPMAQ